MNRHILILVENLSVPPIAGCGRKAWHWWRRDSTSQSSARPVPVATASPKPSSKAYGSCAIRCTRRPAVSAATSGSTLRPCGIRFGWRSRCARERRIDIVQACNPPDLLFLIALVLRPFGARFVFDHHDLVPELFASRYPGRRALYWLTFAERLTFACADAVISTNESYRRVAIERGKIDPDRVAVVRSAPDLSRFIARVPDVGLRRGKPYLLAYLGVMGQQDGVDYALRAVQSLRDEVGRDDFHCVFMGTGDAFDEMVALSEQLGLADIVDFPGWADDEFILRCLSTADVCLSPDPMSPFNDASTMNKIVEYMAMGRSIVTFDLTEARVSAGDAADYVPANDERAFAKAVDALLNDPGRRREMGDLGRHRVERELSWDASRRTLVAFYEQLLGARPRQLEVTNAVV